MARLLSPVHVLLFFGRLRRLFLVNGLEDVPHKTRFLQSSHPTPIQELSNMLSTPVPSTLPYGGEAKAAIEQHLLAMIKEYQGLQVKTAPFTRNDGRTSLLLHVSGTIPMFYKDEKYNVPVVFWLVEAYPRAPPVVLLQPTPDMMINTPHRYVDASGNVTVPYLQQWAYPQSNLVELIRSLSFIFGKFPPLYARSTPVPTPRQQPSTAQSAVASRPVSQSSIHATNPLHAGATPGWSSRTVQQGTPIGEPASRLSRPPYTVDASSPGSPSRRSIPAVRPEAHFRANAVMALTDRLQRDSRAVLRRGAADMNRLFNRQVLLNERKDMLDQGLQDLQRERENLEEQLQIHTTNTDVLESWLQGNEGVQSPPSSVDDLFQPVDDLSRQLLDCTAADLAIDDLLYSLDRAVQDGCIEWEAYYRSVRQLSREQFYHRATCIKASAVMRQLQIGKMAGRITGYNPDGSSANY